MISREKSEQLLELTDEEHLRTLGLHDRDTIAALRSAAQEERETHPRERIILALDLASTVDLTGEPGQVERQLEGIRNVLREIVRDFDMGRISEREIQQLAAELATGRDPRD
jgi:hypothetical protein